MSKDTQRKQLDINGRLTLEKGYISNSMHTYDADEVVLLQKFGTPSKCIGAFKL
jgi:hypothetical protein